MEHLPARRMWRVMLRAELGYVGGLTAVFVILFAPMAPLIAITHALDLDGLSAFVLYLALLVLGVISFSFATRWWVRLRPPRPGRPAMEARIAPLVISTIVNLGMAAQLVWQLIERHASGRWTDHGVLLYLPAWILALSLFSYLNKRGVFGNRPLRDVFKRSDLS